MKTRERERERSTLPLLYVARIHIAENRRKTKYYSSQGTGRGERRKPSKRPKPHTRNEEEDGSKNGS